MATRSYALPSTVSPNFNCSSSCRSDFNCFEPIREWQTGEWRAYVTSLRQNSKTKADSFTSKSHRPQSTPSLSLPSVRAGQGQSGNSNKRIKSRDLNFYLAHLLLKRLIWIFCNFDKQRGRSINFFEQNRQTGQLQGSYRQQIGFNSAGRVSTACTAKITNEGLSGWTADQFAHLEGESALISSGNLCCCTDEAFWVHLWQESLAASSRTAPTWHPVSIQSLKRQRELHGPVPEALNFTTSPVCIRNTLHSSLVNSKTINFDTCKYSI